MRRTGDGPLSIVGGTKSARNAAVNLARWRARAQRDALDSSEAAQQSTAVYYETSADQEQTDEAVALSELIPALK